MVPDAESLFELFGVSLDVYDIVKERGSEIVLDLNEPYPENSQEQYDYVLDVGTLEHCFNVAQAGKNMAGLLRVGGIILHENPFNWGNHGFYGLNPTWYHDFYTDNGFEILEIALLPRGCEPLTPPQTKRFGFTEVEANLLAIARRVEVKPFVWPVQTKYRSK
jgi:SAM-dependent methyltransferase